MGTPIYEYIAWALFAIVKFIATPSLMIYDGHSWLGTMITVMIGVTVGFSLFYWFGEFIFRWFRSLRKTPPKRFTKTNRWIVNLRQRFGIVGIGLICGIVSVPIAGLLTARFFPDPKRAIPAMLMAFGIWTLVLTSLSYLVRHHLI